MNKRLIFICMMGVLLFLAGELHAENVVIGEIIEISENKNIIQVGDQIFEGGTVFLDYGRGAPGVSWRHSLSIGSLVQVYALNKDKGIWKAEKIIVFRGAKKAEVLKELE